MSRNSHFASIDIGSTAIRVVVGQKREANESNQIIAASEHYTEGEEKRAIEAAEVVAVPPNYKLLHNIPKNFTVDGQSGIKDPIGMTGSRLEVETQVIHCLSSHIENISKCAT